MGKIKSVLALSVTVIAIATGFASTARSGLLDHPQQHDQQNRADRRDKNAAEESAAGREPEKAEQESADQRAEDADHDVAQHTKAAAFTSTPASQPAINPTSISQTKSMGHSSM